MEKYFLNFFLRKIFHESVSSCFIIIIQRTKFFSQVILFKKNYKANFFLRWMTQD